MSPSTHEHRWFAATWTNCRLFGVIFLGGDMSDTHGYTSPNGSKFIQTGNKAGFVLSRRFKKCLVKYIYVDQCCSPWGVPMIFQGVFRILSYKEQNIC